MEKSIERLKLEMDHWKSVSDRVRNETDYLAIIRNDMTNRIDNLQNERVKADTKHTEILREIVKRQQEAEKA